MVGIGFAFFFRFFTSSRRDFSMFWSSLAVSLVGITLDFILQQQRSVPKRFLRRGVNYFDYFRIEQNKDKLIVLTGALHRSVQRTSEIPGASRFDPGRLAR